MIGTAFQSRQDGLSPSGLLCSSSHPLPRVEEYKGPPPYIPLRSHHSPSYSMPPSFLGLQKSLSTYCQSGLHSLFPRSVCLKQPAPQPCMWSDLSLGSAHGSWVKWACGWKLEVGLGSYPMSRWGFWDVWENCSWKEKDTRLGLIVLRCHVLSRNFKAYRSLT